MKFVSDSEQVFPHSTLSHKVGSKPFEYHENGLDSTGPKSENIFVKEYRNGALCALKTNEGVADHLPYSTNDADGWTARKLYRSQSLDDLANENEKDVRDREAPDSQSCGEMESFEESVFYVDRSITECELPELIVCYKESTYHVKDICIDEGVPSQDRILFESNVDEKSVCTVLPPEEDRNGELMEAKRNSVVSLPDMLKASAENDFDEDIVNKCDSSHESDSDEDIVDQCDSKDLMPAVEVKDDEGREEITNDVTIKLFSLEDLLSMHNWSTENSHPNSSNNDGIEAERESSQGSGGNAALANHALACTAEESIGDTEEAILADSDKFSASEESKNISGEATLPNPALVSTTEKAHNNSKESSLGSLDLVSAFEESINTTTVDKLSYNSKVETGSITFDFDASAAAPAARNKEEPLQNGDSEYIETPGMSRFEDTPRQSISSRVSSRVHSSLGESSFSASGPLPGLITYSGPIAYSGNISLRSDSSTTSTRSFAFPILQSEWNSSPVRMAKADRRRYRKHKCWRQGLLCCRF